MENYYKGESRRVFDPPNLHLDGTIEMKVTAGSKIRNVMGFALSSMSNADVRHITWNATGNAIHKAISCAEIVKRKIKGLHQITQIGYMRIEDDWIPKVEGQGLDNLKVNTNVPAISVLLSKDPLDASNPSYQAPGVDGLHWVGSTEKRHQPTKSHKNAAAVRNLKSAASKPKRSKGDYRKDNKKSAPKNQSETTQQDQADER